MGGSFGTPRGSLTVYKEYIYVHWLCLRKYIHEYEYSLKQAFGKLVILVNLTSWSYGKLILCWIVSLRIPIGHIDPEQMYSLCDQKLMGPLYPPRISHSYLREKSTPNHEHLLKQQQQWDNREPKGHLREERRGTTSKPGEGQWVECSPGLRSWETEWGWGREGKITLEITPVSQLCISCPPVRNLPQSGHMAIFVSQIPLASHTSNGSLAA